MNKNKIIYLITGKDIQNVAEQELNRTLSDIEIKQLVEPIEEKINWYDVIAEAIAEKIEEKSNSII
jgi:hypothetical protein